MGRMKELYIEMLERDLESLTLSQYMQLIELQKQYEEEQFLKEQNKEDK
jgi:hypothetical protein